VNCLRQLPATVRFISAEPLLGRMDQLRLDGLLWVTTGAERGAGHRGCDPAWVRDVRNRCVAAGVAYFHKQWGGRMPKAGGRMIDGRTWDELPSQSMPREQPLPLW
jgi:protein gp37